MAELRGCDLSHRVGSLCDRNPCPRWEDCGTGRGQKGESVAALSLSGVGLGDGEASFALSFPPW